MHTLVHKLVALSVEKYYMALTEIQLKICRFHGSLSQKGSRPLTYAITFGLSMLYLSSNISRTIGQHLGVLANQPLKMQGAQCLRRNRWYLCVYHLLAFPPQPPSVLFRMNSLYRLKSSGLITQPFSTLRLMLVHPVSPPFVSLTAAFWS